MLFATVDGEKCAVLDGIQKCRGCEANFAGAFQEEKAQYLFGPVPWQNDADCVRFLASDWCRQDPTTRFP